MFDRPKPTAGCSAKGRRRRKSCILLITFIEVRTCQVFRLQRVKIENSVLSNATNSCDSMSVLKNSRYSQRLRDMNSAAVRLSCCQPSDLYGINHFSRCHYMLQSQASMTGCREAVCLSLWRFVTCGTNCDFIYSDFPFLSNTNVQHASQSRGLSSYRKD